jgi:hypothetical protein
MQLMEMNGGELISFVFGGKVELFHGSIFNTICKLADCESNVPQRVWWSTIWNLDFMIPFST